MPRLRKRAVGMSIGAALLFFLGTNVQAGWLFVIAALLLGAVVAGSILPARMVRRLEVERHAPAEVHQGDDVLVELSVTNRGRGMRLGVVASDPFLEPVDVTVPSLASGERAEVATRRRATRRGPQGGAPVGLRSTAPFGVAEHRRTVHDVSGTETLVLPAVFPIGVLPFVRSAATQAHAIHTLPRRGQGPDYLGIREYRPGDSMRHVHWPSTARTGVVMVREFEEEQTRRLAIVIDASLDEGDAWTVLDRVCAAAASVALAATAQGHGARLIAGTHDGPEVVSRADEDHLLRYLALVMPAGPTFAALLAGLGPELRGVETAVLIAPTWNANAAAGGLPAAVAALADRMPTVVAILVTTDPEESGRRALDDAGTDALARSLRAAGADVVTWGEGQDLAARLAGREEARPA
ncbi:MAG: DUF58 domain-containing protein [Actinomycetota bacterium]